MKTEKYEKIPFSKLRRSSLDAGRLSRHKNIVHGLLEVDVTTACRALDYEHPRNGEQISFTAFIIYCLGKAIKKHKHLHAYMNWRKQLVIFEHVNIVAMIESKLDDIRVPVPHLFKAVDTADLLEIHQEIRYVQAHTKLLPGTRYLRWFYRLPGSLRLLLSTLVLKVPHWFRKYSSPAMVTSVGMFDRAAGWGIPKSSFTLTVTIGGITKKPWIVNGQIAIRDILHLTLSIDHDIVDGAPATRFVHDLRTLIESGAGLPGCWQLAEKVEDLPQDENVKYAVS